MPKGPKVVGFLAISAALTGWIVALGTPAVSASARGAVVTVPGVDHRALGDDPRAHERHRAGQHGRHRQREHGRQRENQHLLRDVTLAVTPAQKDETDSQALPYNSQKTDASANPQSDQHSRSDVASGGGAPEAIDRYLRDLAARNQFTGSVLVARRGKVLARFASGLADEANDIPNRPGTIFRVASVTKQFTSMLVLKLRDRGLLGLDDPICPYLIPTYITTCPADWQPITIRELLIHTSGIPDYQNLPGFYTMLSQPTTTREIISRFVNLPLTSPPGTTWKYTSSGYIVAGAIIQSVTHKPYGTVLREEITRPLHLKHTGYSRGNPPDGYAKGYFTVGSPAPPINGSEAFSATGLYTTTDDLVRWDRAFGADLVAPPATVEEAFTPQAQCPANGCLNLPSSAYAFGWLVDTLEGHRLRYHPGLLTGYSASNMYLPDDDIEVVVLSNVEKTDTNGIARRLATIALDS
ncbi:serine hydrolase domain-containing protein [Microbispora sp. NPDC049125]|uniref:serine hydrolase domain-containing protein n=1 Tax=Microbispora sp. NPDC049125 TaxID=3154929 RepID=UPI0034675645